jgi:hypothetical protein
MAGPDFVGHWLAVSLKAQCDLPSVLYLSCHHSRLRAKSSTKGSAPVSEALRQSRHSSF